jgi:chemotaxis protein CheY-P-specific phosphatase CheC
MTDWNRILSHWIDNTTSEISTMLHYNVEVESTNIEHVSGEQISDILGGSNSSTVGIFQRLPGEADGHIMIAYQLRIAHQLLDALFRTDLIPSKSLSEIRQSAICELCNHIMKSFITSMNEALGFNTKTSLPVVLVDSAESIEGIAKVEIALGRDNVFILHSVLQLNGKSLPAKFVVMLCNNVLQLSSTMIAGPA